MSILPGAELGQRIGPMTSIMDMSRLLFAVGCFVFLSATKAAAGDWPDGCVVCENTQSPDERYGILVPSMDAWETIAKQSHDPESSGGDATPHFRIGADRKVRVGTVSTTDPKQLNEKGGYYALFHGTFDLRSKKWLMAEARPLTRNEYDRFGDLFGDLELDETTFATEEDKAKGFDDRMNEVYLAVRLVLPPARFAVVKKGQIEWLKKRDATTSIEEKCKLMEARIKVLQELLW